MAQYQTELRHYGVLGMKWGVRRYQNRDGTLTSKGKNRYRKVRKKQEKKAASQPKESAKGKMPKFTKAALLIGGTTIGVIALRLHAKNKREARLAGKDVGVVAGKKFIEGVLGDSKEGIMSGVKEGTKTGSQTLASVLASGSVLYLGKKAADIMLGKDNSGRIFQAANKKKISSFWTYTDAVAAAKKDGKNDDDDDD